MRRREGHLKSGSDVSCDEEAKWLAEPRDQEADCEESGMKLKVSEREWQLVVLIATKATDDKADKVTGRKLKVQKRRKSWWGMSSGSLSLEIIKPQGVVDLKFSQEDAVGWTGTNQSELMTKPIRWREGHLKSGSDVSCDEECQVAGWAYIS